MNVLAVEPYYSGSHKAFLKGLARHSTHNIIPVKLNFKGWKWRMHGDSVTLAEMTKNISDEIDLLLCSSMMNLPAFVALTNPRFVHTAKIMYMHDNQFTRPIPSGEQRDMTYCYINYLSMLVANKLIFSSQFHLEDLLQALPGFLNHFPGDKHYLTVDEIRDKSVVLYPGLDLSYFNIHSDTRKENKRPECD